VQEGGGKRLNAILEEVLGAQPSLVIFDNFEHVLQAAPFVAELLSVCPELVVLATSREGLGLRSEHIYFVEPLAVPDLDHLDESATIRQAASVVLFEERARAKRAGFQLSDDALATVARICARLDGLPLAIELAAAQSAVLTPPVILKRLETRAPLIGAVHRDLPLRHQTLQSTVAWGYDLLEPIEQRVFRACGVFAGGFTAEAVERVCWPSAEVDVLGVLAQLVTKSLVRVAEDATDEPRFWLLETIRGYAFDQLTLEDGLADARSRHAAYYVELAENAQEALSGQGVGAALDNLALEYANFRSAFRWSSETGDLEVGLRLAAALYRFWLARGPLTEARIWLEAALPHSQTVTPAIRAAALNAAGGLAGIQLDHDRAAEWFRQSLELWTVLGVTLREADVRHNLGLVAHLTGDVEDAKRQFERAHAMYVAHGDRSKQAKSLGSRGRLARAQEDLKQAMRLTEDSLQLYEAVGDVVGMAHQLANLGHVRLELRDRQGAGDAFRRALDSWRALGNIIELAECLDGVAATSSDAQPRRAVQLLGAAEALRDRSGATVAAVEQRRYRELVAQLKSRLRAEAFEAAWREGRGLALDRAVELALHTPEARAERVLSPREHEIALLVARGQSNNEISENLVVSIKTVETHIQHIFRKLNVKRRAEIAAWAVREGLT
jgi:non-specific serine/threonine protein kinase